MNPPITLTFRYQPREVVRAVNAQVRRSIQAGYVAALATLFLISADEIVIGKGTYFWVGVIMAAIGLALVAWPVLKYLVVRRQLPRSLPDEYHFTFSEDGTRMRSTSFDANCSWSYYKNAAILQEFYLLYIASPGRGYHIIPKRAFLNAVDRSNFEALLTAKLPIGARVKAKRAVSEKK
jgi:hypothetical protein